ncbi:hypothetical protein HB780_18480 [Rhizobium lusitanum]|uniref:hypothetical protein n=1 Tax=Rhizobium lusitanum TaxID=293958 RepID=UPI001619520C|nr:hypothetical protein [Rhizobium lusitanum]QND47664.1 hypothetical protein HB780_18480 [Rhizobium lusitanum]
MSAVARFRAVLALWLLVRLIRRLERLLSSPEIERMVTERLADRGAASAIRARYGALTFLNFKKRARSSER